MSGFDPYVFSSGNRGAPEYDPEVFGTAKPRQLAEPTEQKRSGTGSVALDSGNAVGTGFWRGVTRLAGLPVDAAANVLDLGRAALGAPYMAVTGKAPPDWLDVPDRATVPGSGEYLVRKARGTAPGRFMVDPVNPEFEGGYLQSAGEGTSAAAAPGSTAQLVNRALIGAGSTTAGKAAYNATGSPELAITASMLPAGAQRYGSEAGKRMVRGDEQGRRNMEQRVADLKAAGIDNPTLGLASGNRVIGGIENLLQSTPGAVGTMGKARERILGNLQTKAGEAADLASTNRGEFAAGNAIQTGLRDFKDRFKLRQAEVWGDLDAQVPPLYPTSVGNTLATLSGLNAEIPGAPALSQQFRNGRIQSIESAMRSDLGQPTAYTPSQLRAAAAQGPQRAADLSTALGEGKLPFSAVKQTRSLVGNEIADNNLASDVPRSKWNPLYGAISEDLRGVAAEVGPDATRAFNRANDFTRAGIGRLDKVAPLADAASPEQAFASLFNAAKGSPSTLQAVKKSLPPDARGAVAATVIEKLGRATPGQQNADGSAWSHERFLTNWSSLSAKAKTELLSGFPNAAEVRQNVDAVAKASAMLRENSKLWANPSGTAAAGTARAFYLGTPLAALVSPLAAAAAAGGLAVTNGAARYLTGPGSTKWATSRASPGLLSVQTRAMQAGGLLGGGGLLEPETEDVLSGLLGR